MRHIRASAIVCGWLVSSVLATDAARQPDATWLRYADVEQAGWSARRLAAAHRWFEQSDAAAAMIVHDGAVLAAWGDTERRFRCHQIGGTALLGALFGVHVEGGEIALDATLAQLGIDDVDPPLGPTDRSARVVDLLRARSGVFHAAAGEVLPQRLARPARNSAPPGTRWWYNQWDFNVLLAVFEQTTGQRFFDDFETRIAAPLGMQDFRARDGRYLVQRPYSLHPVPLLRMSARDLARFGLLVLRGGRWGDRQVVPRAWIEESTRPHSTRPEGGGFGYLWWISGERPFAEHGMVSTLGRGQSLDVLPGLELVVVLRSDTYRGRAVPAEERLELLRRVVRARRGPAAPEPRLVALASSPAPPRATAAQLRDHAGIYALRPGTVVRVANRDGVLVLDAGEGQFDLVPVSRNEFRIADTGEGVVFRPGRFPGVVTDSLLRREAYYQLLFGRRERAMELLALGVRYFPDSPDAHAALGEAYALGGDLANALASYERALLLAPGDSRVASIVKTLRARRGAQGRGSDDGAGE